MLTRTQVGFTTMNEALAARAARLAGHEPRPAH
jgi:hypothetical protein